MSEFAPNRPRPDRLEGWKEIALYLRRDVRTVQRWETHSDLPIRRLDHRKRSSVYALPDELDRWRLSRDATPPKPPEPPRRPQFVPALGLAATVSLLVAVFAAGNLFDEDEPPALLPVPLTSLPGGILFPGFTPDGESVLFSWTGPDGDDFDIYEMHIATGKLTQITDNPAEDALAVYLPDGRTIAVLRHHADRSGVYLLERGQPGERLLTGTTSATLSVFPAAENSLLVKERPGEGLPLQYFAVSMKDGSRRPALEWASTGLQSGGIVLSPDGRYAAFSVFESSFVADLYVSPLDGSEPPRRLAFDRNRLRGIAWTPDSREVVFSASREGTLSLWRIPIEGGEPRQISGVGRAFSPVLWSDSAGSSKLLFATGGMNADAWSVALNQPQAPPQRVTHSTRYDGNAQISPDSTKLCFASHRFKDIEHIFVSDLDGGNVEQITRWNEYDGAPRWSPDGKQIAFDSLLDGNWDIYAVSLETGTQRRLTRGPNEDVRPSWSRDGRWIYYSAGDGRGGSSLWKAPADGGEPVLLNENGGFEAFEAPDGNSVYFVETDRSVGLWRIPASGAGSPTPVPGSEEISQGRWSVTPLGIYFRGFPDPAKWDDGTPIYRIPLEGGQPELIRTIPADPSIDYSSLHPVRRPPGFSVSADGRTAIVQRRDELDTGLMLIEDFR